MLRVWPLRLLTVGLKEDGELTSLRILVRVDLGPSSPFATPFGVDGAFGYGNVATLNALSATMVAATLTFRDTFRWEGTPVPATLTYEMPNGEDGSLKGAWSISFELAGEAVELKQGKLLKDRKIAFGEFGPPELRIAVTADPIHRTLTFSPTLKLLTSGGKIAIQWNGGQLTWFEKVTVACKNGLDLASGVFKLEFKQDAAVQAFEIVPGVSLGIETIQGALQVVTGALSLRTLYAEVWAGPKASNLPVRDLPDLRAVHRMVVADPAKPVVFDLLSFTGTICDESKIQWPDVTQPNPSGTSVQVEIPKADSTWKHNFTIHLNDHRYPLDRVSGGWDFDAPVRHTLSKGENTFSWESLDRLCILSAAGFKERAAVRGAAVSGYLPVQKHDTSPHYFYRGKDVYSRVFAGGEAEGDLASSGLWDQDLTPKYQQLTKSLILGGGLTLFSNGLPLLWHYVSTADALFPQLQQRDPKNATVWTLSTPDVPPEILVQERDAKITRMGTPSEQEILYMVEGVPRDPTKFENWLDPTAKPDTSQHPVVQHPEWIEQILFEQQQNMRKIARRGSAATPEATPFFLGTLLAVPRIRAEGATPLWSLRVSEREAALCARVGINLQSKVQSIDTEPPQIVVLSAKDGAKLGELLPADAGAAGTKARLTSIARERVVQPVAAVLRCKQPPLLSVRDLLHPVLDLHSAPKTAKPTLDVVAPSSALGWPALVSADDALRMNPVIGGEAVIVDFSSGLAGRTAASAWPAYGPDGNTPPFAIYMNSHAPVIFERAPEMVPFQGPVARHMSPVPTRVRAPLFSELTPALLKLVEPINKVLQGTPPTEQPLAFPISTPDLERGVLGLRPGAFHAITISATIPGNEVPFDSDSTRFGHPASRGPVVVHQLRAPRGTPLPNDREFALRRRTFLSEAEPEKLFGQFDGSAVVWRDDFRNGKWRFSLQPAQGQPMMSADWDGTFGLYLEAVSSGNICNLKDALELTGLTRATCQLNVDDKAFTFESIDTTHPPSIALKMARGAEAAEAIRTAGPDTRLWLAIQLQQEPKVSLTLPLQLKPPNRRVLELSTTTIAFGDPSYDRQLGSPAQMDIRVKGSVSYGLSADRRKYERTGSVYFAFGEIQTSGEFKKSGVKQPVELKRFPASDGDPITLNQLPVEPGVAKMIALPDLGIWSSGDQLSLSVTTGGVTLTITVSIVDEPQIAPPPAVYSVVRLAKGNAFADVPLHASGPMPQRIEFPSLVEDLAQGHVRRRALFLWRSTEVRQEGVLTLIKVDRTGGTQIPVPINISIQSGKLIATVVGRGKLFIDNGLLLKSQEFPIEGSTDIGLGPANPGLYGFRFRVGNRDVRLLASLDRQAVLTATRELSIGTCGEDPATAVLEKFWSSLTAALLKLILAGPLGQWIATNGMSVSTNLTLGALGNCPTFLVADSGKASELVVQFIDAVVDAVLTKEEGESITRWAAITNDTFQIPTTLVPSTALEEAMVTFTNNVTVESTNVRLTVCYSVDTGKKYGLALKTSVIS